MPYVFKEVLDDGEQAAEVMTMEEKETLQGRIDDLELQGLEAEENMKTLQAERDSLAEELEGVRKSLDDAKKKFADAFLSSPQHVNAHKDDVKKDSKSAVTLSQLFNERTTYAN